MAARPANRPWISDPEACDLVWCRLFSGFGEWFPVSPLDLRPARTAVPYKPGLYEWGAMAPGVCSSAIVAFYLGKAGTLKAQTNKDRGSGGGRQRGQGSETLRTRFNKYAVAGRLLGPSQEEGEKMAMFRELQRRGFSLWYRWARAGAVTGGTSEDKGKGAIVYRTR